MNIGHAYMAIAALFVFSGSLMGINGIDPYGDIFLAISIPLIYYGSRKMADARKEGKVANYDVE